MSQQITSQTPRFNKWAKPYCQRNAVYVTTLTVTVVPDPIVSGQNATFTISGTAKSDIPIDVTLWVAYGNPDESIIGAPYEVPFCGSSVPCPVKNGDTFNRKLTAQAPTLPDAYIVAVVIGTTQPIFYGCAVAGVGTAPPVSLEQIF